MAARPRSRRAGRGAQLRGFFKTKSALRTSRSFRSRKSAWKRARSASPTGAVRVVWTSEISPSLPEGGDQRQVGVQTTPLVVDGVVYLGGTPWTQFTLSSLEPLVKQENGVTEVVVTAVYPEE